MSDKTDPKRRVPRRPAVASVPAAPKTPVKPRGLTLEERVERIEGVLRNQGLLG